LKEHNDQNNKKIHDLMAKIEELDAENKNLGNEYLNLLKGKSLKGKEVGQSTLADTLDDEMSMIKDK
jgi:hypothetical protein